MEIDINQEENNHKTRVSKNQRKEDKSREKKRKVEKGSNKGPDKWKSGINLVEKYVTSQYREENSLFT